MPFKSALKTELTKDINAGYKIDSARSTLDESIQTELFTEASSSLEFRNELEIKIQQLESERQLAEKKNQEANERTNQALDRLQAIVKTGNRPAVNQETSELKKQPLEEEVFSVKPKKMEAAAPRAEEISGLQQLNENRFVYEKNKQLEKELEIYKKANEDTALKLREIQDCEKYIRKEKLQQEQPNMSEEQLKIMEQTVKIFEDKLIISKKDLEIAQENAVTSFQSIQQISDELKWKTGNVSEIQKKMEQIVEFRKKTTEVKQGRETGAARIEALQSIEKQCQNNIVEIIKKKEEIVAAAVTELNEISLEIEDSTGRFNENSLSYEENIKELKNLEAIASKNLSNPIRERIAELKQKIPTKENEFGAMSGNKLEEFVKFNTQFKMTGNKFAEQIDIYDKTIQVELKALDTIIEVKAVKTQELLSEMRNPSKEHAKSNLPASELQLKEISEEKRKKDIKFSETIIKGYEKKLTEFNAELKKSNSGAFTAFYEESIAHYTKLREQEFYKKHQLMGVPEEVKSLRHGMLVSAPCSAEAKKTENRLEDSSKGLLSQTATPQTQVEKTQALIEKDKKEDGLKRTGAIRKKKAAPNSDTSTAKQDKQVVQKPTPTPLEPQLSATRSSYKESIDRAVGNLSSASWASFYLPTAQQEEKQKAEAEKAKLEQNKFMQRR